MKRPLASIIIPHHGNLEPLDRCLSSLAQCHDLASVETIVVANGPLPLGLEFQKSHPCVLFSHEPRIGAAHARNAGVAIATADLILFIDSDCILAPDTISEALKAASTADIVGGNVIAAAQRSSALSPTQAFEVVFAFDQATYIHKKGFSVTACLLTKRATFHKVGPFRPGVSEDLDWCHRASALGFTLAFAPQICVYHPCRTNWASLRDKWQRLTAETYALRVHSKFQWIAKACLMPVSILAHAPRVIACAKLKTPRDKAAALAMLVRIRLWRMGEMLKLSLQSRA